jgi:nitrite reductase/ring-hydroxylating ferredoxin subunit/uncharacterized membrane protein
MDGEAALQLIDRQDWIEPAADALQQGVHAAFDAAGEAGQQIKDALHGTWMGHPVHSAITDIPVGAWTAALALDALDQMTGRREFATGADGAIVVGLIGAAGAAVTGLTDWSETDGRARKAGIVHGLLNVAATGLYGASLVYRSRHKRAVGRGLAALGFAVACASAWLGGELVYQEHVGIDHTGGGAAAPSDWTAVLPEAELEDHRPERVLAGEFPVMLLRREGRIYAIAATCPHAGGPLDEGEISGNTVTCPWHGSTFKLDSGAVVTGPSCYDVPRFDTRVTNGHIEVRLAKPA